MTWHQWHAAYPTDNSTGTSRLRASAKAASVQGHQSTGLSWCCTRYGEVASANRFMRPYSTGGAITDAGTAARAGQSQRALQRHREPVAHPAGGERVTAQRRDPAVGGGALRRAT